MFNSSDYADLFLGAEQDEGDPKANCRLFYGNFSVLFHISNLIMGLSFAMPQWLKFYKSLVRGCITFGLFLLTIWTATETCASQWFLYNLAGFVVNGVYFLLLTIKHFPVSVPKHLEGVYVKVFKPLRMGKKVGNPQTAPPVYIIISLYRISVLS